jgi:hypothetical protein
MKRKTVFAPAKLLLLLIIATLVFSCDGITSLLGGEDDKPSIPEDILELADGIFSLIGMVFETEADDPTLDTTYPSGMTVAWVTPDVALKITLTNFSPPDDTSGVIANGSITLTLTSTSPYTITLSGTINMSNYTYSSVVLNGTAVWAADQEPGDDSPQSVTGTFTVDGKAYSLADIFAAIEDGDDGGGGGTTITATPLPTIFMTSAGNYSQLFDDRVWRLGPAGTSDPWAEYNYMTFSISDDGARYGLSLGGADSAAGFINWYTSGGVQKLDFLDSAKTSALYSFTVLGYSKNHLHLRTVWGSETREWIFTAGTYNLSGMVVSSVGSFENGPYMYYPPLEGAQIQFGTLMPDFTPVSGISTTTDARGYFYLDGLSAYVGQAVGVQITMGGYTTFTPINGLDTIFISGGESAYKFIILNP